MRKRYSGVSGRKTQQELARGGTEGFQRAERKKKRVAVGDAGRKGMGTEMRVRNKQWVHLHLPPLSGLSLKLSFLRHTMGACLHV